MSPRGQAGPDAGAADAVRSAAAFATEGEPVRAARHGNGHIHDTFRILCRAGAARRHYILQRINRTVFRDPGAVMENFGRLAAHLAALRARGDPRLRGCRPPALVPARDGAACHVDAAGEWWRMQTFVERTRSIDVAHSVAEAGEAARAFGRFHRLVAELDPSDWRDTIPRFHDTPHRLETLEAAAREDAAGRLAGCRREFDFAAARRAAAGRLLAEARAGRMPWRVTHNDTKINNVLFDARTGRGVSIVDLDTLMAGLRLYDFGDLLRTTASPAAEDERDLSRVEFRRPYFDALVRGYLSEAGPLLTPAERELLLFSGVLITLTIGIRFLTDHLRGDVYFRTHRPGHNLDRCRTQFRLVELMERVGG